MKKSIIFCCFSFLIASIIATDIQIMTYNLYMLPHQDLAKQGLLKRAANIIGKGRSLKHLDTDAKGRAPKIPPKIAGLADVFAFQEGFDSTGRKKLRDGMRKAGVPYSTKVLGRSFLKSGRLTNSGLFTMSKYPIDKSKGIHYQDKFKKSSGIKPFADDKLADKGVLYAKILKDGKPFHVFSTHTQAKTHKKDEKPPLGAKIREKQWGRIRAFIDSLNIPKTEPVLIVGDMNIDKANPEKRADRYAEYKRMLEILNATDVEIDKAKSFGYTSLFDQEKVEKSKIPGQWIDYVLYSNTHLKPTKAQAYVPVTDATAKEWENLSDHFPLIGHFEFKGY